MAIDKASINRRVVALTSLGDSIWGVIQECSRMAKGPYEPGTLPEGYGMLRHACKKLEFWASELNAAEEDMFGSPGQPQEPAASPEVLAAEDELEENLGKAYPPYAEAKHGLGKLRKEAQEILKKRMAIRHHDVPVTVSYLRQVHGEGGPDEVAARVRRWLERERSEANPNGRYQEWLLLPPQHLEDVEFTVGEPRQVECPPFKHEMDIDFQPQQAQKEGK
jgi:hypothetical protein